MPFSQNARFGAPAEADPDPDERLPGRAQLQRIAKLLSHEGWSTDEIENWRDSGWSLVVRAGTTSVEVVLAGGKANEFLMQIAPAEQPGLLRGAFGARPSASRSDCYRIAKIIHRFMAEQDIDQRWRWDGYPDADGSTPEPIPPDPRPRTGGPYRVD
jgi:hypothetical protein